MKKLLYVLLGVLFLASCEDIALRDIIQQKVKTANSASWSSVIVYSVDVTVLMPPLVNGGPIYKSLQSGNLSHDPLTETVWWIYDGEQRY